MVFIGIKLLQIRQTSLCFAVVMVLSAFILPTANASPNGWLNDEDIMNMANDKAQGGQVIAEIVEGTEPPATVTTHDEHDKTMEEILASPSYGTTSRSGSGESLLPCSYGGTIILHSHELQVDACTTCRCDNTTLRCDIRSCPPIYCEEALALKFTDTCCVICPYYVPVWKVTPDTLYVISEGQVNHIEFDLTVAINGAGSGVKGEGLWKVGVWASRRADGKDTRIGYTKQILSQEQAATALRRPYYFGSYELNIPEIKYSLNAKNTTCSDMQYLCVEFAKGDDPSLQEPRVPFTVEGVRNDYPLRSTPRNLQGCIPFPGCKDNAYDNIIQTRIGQSVVLPCNETIPTPPPDSASSLPYLTQWKHSVIGSIYVSFGGAPPYIHEQYNGRVSLVDLKSLKIDDVRPDDEGWYECQIVLLDGDLCNTQNGTLSHLIVIDNAYDDIIQTRIGQSVVLPCNETVPTPPPDSATFLPYLTQWKHTVIGSIYVSFGGATPYIHEQYNGRASLVDLKSLKIDDVRPEDEGWYECQIVLLDGDLCNTQNGTLSHLIVIDVPSTQASTTHEVSTHVVSGESFDKMNMATDKAQGGQEHVEAVEGTEPPAKTHDVHDQTIDEIVD